MIDLISRAVEAGTLDWIEAREAIIREHRQAATVEERVLCLGLHKILMDAVERQSIAPEDMEKFRETRLQEYRMLLIQEAVAGRDDGLIPPAMMAKITQREVAAGRMAADDELHTLAVAGHEVLSLPEGAAKGGLFSTMRSWFGSR